MPSKPLKSVSLKRLIKNTPATIKQAVRNELKRRQQNKQQTTARFSKPNLPTAQVFREQAQTASEALSRSGRSVNQVYRKLSGQALDVAVTPLVVGELPDIHPSDDVLTFYVLAEYSRSNSILVDLQTREHDLPPALVAVRDSSGYVDENAGILFLHHPNARDRKVSPRLARLVSACRQHPNLNIQLVPVSIVWGRSPDKEDSIFKLLMADNWQEPTLAKQLFNIGVMGRDTFIQFHEPLDLHRMIADLAKPSEANASIANKTEQNPPAVKTTASKAITDNSQSADLSNIDADLASDAVDNSHTELSQFQFAEDLVNDKMPSEDEQLIEHARHQLEAEQQAQKHSEAKTNPTTHLITSEEANFSLSLLISHQLGGYLDAQRTSILGPDLSDKRNLIDKLVNSPAIAHACQVEADNSDNGMSRKDARRLARGYAEEIVNDYSYPVIRFFDTFLTWLWTQLYDGVEVHHFERVRTFASDHELVYVPCHRSHMDYLLLAYVIYKWGLSVPYVAAGDNLNVPIIGTMLRRAVAFYIRRSFKDNELYKAVLKQYLHMLIGRQTPIEYFIEGGRSRSGRLLPPKLGMLAMTVHSQLRDSSKPVVFVPTYIGYERIMEGGTYLGELRGKPKESESFLGLLKASRKIERIFGHVQVSFGTPLPLADFMAKFDVPADALPPHRTDTDLPSTANAMIDNLSVKIMQNINKAAAINPITLLALVLLSTPKAALDETQCRKQLALCQQLAKNLPYHEDTIVTDMTPAGMIDYGIKLKLIERTPHILGDMIRVVPKQVQLLSYFRNNILHIYILPSFLAALVVRNGHIARSRLKSLATDMYPFLQSELFLYYAIRTLDDRLDTLLAGLIGMGVMVETSDDELGIPDANSEAYQQLVMLAHPVSQSLERYFMTLALLAQQGSGNLTAEQVVDLCHLLGQRLSILYADDSPEFFDRALFVSFINALIRLEYLHKNDDETLRFDDRIANIARYAYIVLSTDAMQILQNMAAMDKADIENAIEQINQKRARRFMKRG